LDTFFSSIAAFFETALRASSESVKEFGPHPEELAKQASRRMDAKHRLAAILRDAREGALLRMRPEIYSQAVRMRSHTLMVRSATSRVSNQEVTGIVVMIRADPKTL
jgi:hypothetical protein